MGLLFSLLCRSVNRIVPIGLAFALGVGWAALPCAVARAQENPDANFSDRTNGLGGPFSPQAEPEDSGNGAEVPADLGFEAAAQEQDPYRMAPPSDPEPALPTDPVLGDSPESPIAGGSTVRKRLFLAFSFSNADLYSRPDRNSFYEILLLHYNTAPTQASSEGYFQYWQQYRRQVRAVNPQAIVGIYYSAITSQNPTNPGQYSYPTTDSDLSGFLCDDPNNSGVYDPRPDSHSFYQPRYLADRPDWSPWGVGLFGRWPFYDFQSRGWMLPQTTYLCRPIINIANPQVRTFVANEAIQALSVRYPYANAISFDNGSMLRSSYDSWPGKNQPLSPYATRAPDADFFAYLDQVRAAVRSVGGKLVVNTGYGRKVAPHADVVFFEGGFSKQQSATQFRTMLEDTKGALDAGASVVQRFSSGDVIGRIDADMQGLMYFLAASMLVYQDGRFAFDPQLWNPTYFQFYPAYFLLPTWLGDPLSAYREPQTDLYYRQFQNGVVVLNASSHRVALPPALQQSMGITSYGVPDSLNSRSAVVIISNCSGLPTNADCVQVYRSWPRSAPLKPGDMNCDNTVNSDDNTPFILALSSASAYAAMYPYCDIRAGDMNADGLVNDVDYQRFREVVYHGGQASNPDLAGDMDCDGYITNLDINPFLEAIVSPQSYLVHYPNCDIARADLDQDGAVRLFDMNLFLDVLMGN